MNLHRGIVGVMSVFLAILAISALLPSAALAQEDAENSVDHPLLGRMPGFIIEEYEANFNADDFYVNEEDKQTFEGERTYIVYGMAEGTRQPSDLQITRNYTKAVQKLGGQVIHGEREWADMKLIKDGREIWIRIESLDGGARYALTVLEVGEMDQDVETGDLADKIKRQGYATVYINFDTGRADIKPESMGIIEKIAQLMADNPELKLKIEGHTDNTGSAEANQRLSEERAQSVVDTLMDQGVDENRLRAVGMGMSKPVADNDTEEGRAKNRRVELVRM